MRFELVTTLRTVLKPKGTKRQQLDKVATTLTINGSLKTQDVVCCDQCCHQACPCGLSSCLYSYYHHTSALNLSMTSSLSNLARGTLMDDILWCAGHHFHTRLTLTKRNFTDLVTITPFSCLHQVCPPCGVKSQLWSLINGLFGVHRGNNSMYWQSRESSTDATHLDNLTNVARLSQLLIQGLTIAPLHHALPKLQMNL
jgi:hypothetical protein